MIQVKKPAKAPAVLVTKGKSKRRAHVAAYNRGIREFTFDAKIYGHKTVKETLIKAQHDKCFLCESKITHISFGDVEHFRPKAAYRQSAGGPLQKPGYYWLAYDWSNLFLACQLCNQLFKKNLFPLADPSARAVSHRDKTEREQPLFIDPSIDDPEKYISFRREVPYPINDNPRGKAVIKALGLARPKLNEKRLERYRMLEQLYLIAFRVPLIPESERARELLAEAELNNAEYTSMARAAITAKFTLVV
jgi:uncharacterized protein (TIGR02646 family)